MTKMLRSLGDFRCFTTTGSDHAVPADVRDAEITTDGWASAALLALSPAADAAATAAADAAAAAAIACARPGKCLSHKLSWGVSSRGRASWAGAAPSLATAPPCETVPQGAKRTRARWEQEREGCSGQRTPHGGPSKAVRSGWLWRQVTFAATREQPPPAQRQRGNPRPLSNRGPSLGAGLAEGNGDPGADKLTVQSPRSAEEVNVSSRTCQCFSDTSPGSPAVPDRGEAAERAEFGLATHPLWLHSCAPPRVQRRYVRTALLRMPGLPKAASSLQGSGSWWQGQSPSFTAGKPVCRRAGLPPPKAWSSAPLSSPETNPAA